MNYTDQIGNSISLPAPPKRIVSVVPSQTELLYDLGLDSEVVGITTFCVHPKHWRKTKTGVGGTKKLNLEKIRSLKPDLIIANKEENLQGEIEFLQKEIPVWTSNISTLEEALQMIESIGQMTGKENASLKIQNDIREQFSILKISGNTNNLIINRLAYFIWIDPLMCAGPATFIGHLLKFCGFENILGEVERYTELTDEQLIAKDPQIIFLSSEPYPFKEKHIEHFRKLCPTARIMLVDGEMFSWYGSRLLYAPAYFGRLLDNLSRLN